MRAVLRALWRLAALFMLSALALQLYFVARIGLMAVVDPQSTTFQQIGRASCRERVLRLV